VGLIAPDAISQIEIVNGAGTLLYGSDARLLFHRRDKVAVATLVLPVLPSTKSEVGTKTVREFEPEMRS